MLIDISSSKLSLALEEEIQAQFEDLDHLHETVDDGVKNIFSTLKQLKKKNHPEEFNAKLMKFLASGRFQEEISNLVDSLSGVLNELE